MILVTGAGGFIGKQLTSYLMSRNTDVMPLFRSDTPRLDDTCWRADLERRDHITYLKKTKRIPKTVVHLAGYIEINLQADPARPEGAPVVGTEDIARIYTANVAATAHILDFCLGVGVEHLVFASSQTVYGMPVHDVLTEESPCAPLEHYANSKLCCEKILELSTGQGIDVTALRFPGVYGEGRKSGVVYNFCRAAVQDGRIEVKTDMPLPFDVIHVDDLVDCLGKVIEYNGKGWVCLNVSTGEPCSLDMVADDIADIVPGCIVAHGEITQPIVRMDPSRAHALLGWKARPRRESLKRIVDTIPTGE